MNELIRLERSFKRIPLRKILPTFKFMSKPKSSIQSELIMKFLILLCAVIACVAAQDTCNDDQIKEYKKWQRKHNRPIYDKETELKRCTHFLRALQHVKENSGNSKSHKVALNEMADLSPEEYKSRHGIIVPVDYKHESSPPNQRRRKKAAGGYPPSKDWRDENIITHVKNQGMQI